MNPPEIARRLVELCRQGAYETAQRELYAADAVSIEPQHSPQPPAKGLEAIVAKGKGFLEMMEVHGGTVSEAIVAGPFFSLAMTLDLTPRAGGPRFTMEEICVYEVKDGKIVREQFFYSAD
jgi:SnoaL-like protein